MSDHEKRRTIRVVRHDTGEAMELWEGTPCITICEDATGCGCDHEIEGERLQVVSVDGTPTLDDDPGSGFTAAGARIMVNGEERERSCITLAHAIFCALDLYDREAAFVEISGEWARCHAETWRARSARLEADIRAASEALTVAGIPDDGRGLAERVTALWDHVILARPRTEADRERARQARAEGDEADARLDRFLAETAPPAVKRKLFAPGAIEATLPDLGITVAHGATAQALAEDVASQVFYVVAEIALADPATLAPDALALRTKLRARLGMDDAALAGPPAPSGLDLFEASFGEGREAWDTPEGRRFMREMRGGLDEHGVPLEPDIERAVGDPPPEAR